MTPGSLYEVHSSAVPLAADHARRLGFDRVTPVGGEPDDPPWDREWAQDVLRYLGRDPIHRRWHHDELTRRAWAEDRVLPLSVEVLGPSPLDRLHGDEWQKRANLRVLLALAWGLPGQKLLFMGNQLGAGVEHLIGDLNRLYHTEAALGLGEFQWIDAHDAERSVITFLRRHEGSELVLAYNLTPVPRPNYRIGVPRTGLWREILDTDGAEYGGSGQGNLGGVEASPLGLQGQPASLTVMLPPLGAVWFKPAD